MRDDEQLLRACETLKRSDGPGRRDALLRLLDDAIRRSAKPDPAIVARYYYIAGDGGTVPRSLWEA